MEPLRLNRKRFCLVFGALLTLAAAFVAGIVFLAGPPGRISSFAGVREAYRASDAVLRDRNGVIIHEMRINLTGRSLDWVALPQIPPFLAASVRESEDRRFAAHGGVDPWALMYASFRNLVFGEKRGASTITMQLASQLDPRLRPESKRRSWREKIRQIRAARAIEQRWSKSEILEAYLNLVSFRGELRGIHAASRGLFGKEPVGLDRSESLILAALIRSPNALPQKITERAAALDGQINSGLGRDVLAAKVKETMEKPYRLTAAVSLAPHAASYLLKGGAKDVRSTLDSRLQTLATELLGEQLSRLKAQNVADGAILVVENRTGDILAYVGNGGTLSSALWVDGVRAKRQAGSTLKPLLYALAFDKRVLTAASLIEDSPVEAPTDRGIYKPENYDNTFRGLVPARIALASSLNVPAVRVLMLTGADDFVAKLKELGFSDMRDGEYYGFSLALGTLDVSLLELTNAYRTLANNGVAGSLTLLPRPGLRNGTRVFSREASFIVSDILEDRAARSLTFGYENPLATRFRAAAKTGTSKDMRDNWCVGYSSRYTVGVWIGNFSGSPMWNVSGVSGAAPIWHEIMSELHRNAPPPPATPPAGLVARSPATGKDGTGREEWFLKGTEPLSVEARPVSGARPRILYPPQNLIVALDPDIPALQQKLFFEAAAPGRKTGWVLNGAEIGGGDIMAWSPAPGSYTLTLVDEHMGVLDEVRFVVRN
jgi:penicillin-binding protein 1C